MYAPNIRRDAATPRAAILRLRHRHSPTARHAFHRPHQPHLFQRPADRELAPAAPLAQMRTPILEHNIPFCLGTDSLASNTDLDLWNEVLFFTPNLRPPLSRIFDWLIRNPARFFGLENELGSLTVGKKMVFSVLPEALRQLDT